MKRNDEKIDFREYEVRAGTRGQSVETGDDQASSALLAADAFDFNFHTLDDAAYQSLRYQFFVNNEESGNPKEEVYLDGGDSGNPTIGVGFNLREDDVRQAVLTAFGFDIRDPDEKQYIDRIKGIVNSDYTDVDQLRSDLDDVMADRAADPNIDSTKTTFQFDSDQTIKDVFAELIEGYGINVDNWLAGIPNSKERIVLLSLQYNGGILDESIHLKTAIENGNRARAWYEIRYNSNSKDQDPDIRPGIANRRYRSSDFFGLYDDKSNISEAEARQVLHMFTHFKEDIQTYEDNFSPTNPTAHSQSILDLLPPAENVLIGEYVTDESIPITIETGGGHVLVGDESSNTTKLTGSDDNDLILGGGGDDVVHGGAGSDVIYGEKGKDTLIGEAGGDYLVGGENADMLKGGDGEDTLSGGVLGDILKGGVNNDTLKGGAGSDHLEGDAGFDSYSFSTGNFYPVNPSVDFIDDSDGSGTIKIDGVDFAVGERISYNTWESANGEFINTADLTLGSQTLAIKHKDTGSTILVKNWSNGELGIAAR